MDDFIKFPSIENSYRAKHIAKWLEWYPELKDCKYIVTEKIDGSNIQIRYNPDGTMKIGRRGAWLEEGEKFFNVHEALEIHKVHVENCKKYAKEMAYPFTVYYELTGPKINRRIKYSHYERMRLHVIQVYTYSEFQHPAEFMCKHIPGDHAYYPIETLPIIDIVDGIDAALAISEEFNSKVASIENNPAEGIVIRPYEKNYFDANGSMFILKKKSAAFEEISSVPKTQHKQEASENQIKFLGYINDARVKSAFSKHGEISDIKEMGKYIKLVLEDAKIDFLKDVAVEDPNDRNLFKLGGNAIVGLLKAYL